MFFLLVLFCTVMCTALLFAGSASADKSFETERSDQPGSAPAVPPAKSKGTPRSLKILAIGGSFSMDAMQHLYQIMQEAGVEEIVLGNLFCGGASLCSHLDFASNDTPGYDFYKNCDGCWRRSNAYRISQALAEEEWDYITFQQVSGYSGICTSFDTLPELMDYVRGRNSTAKFLWHMTWAYQADSTHEDFPLYDNDQQNMYRRIVDCVRKCILPNQQVAFVIPAGTAVQNARTSFLGDTLTRDGFHLDKQIGRYIAGMAWCAAITGLPIDSIGYNPDPESISQDMLAVAREAAKNAVANPFAVTRSRIIQGRRV